MQFKIWVVFILAGMSGIAHEGWSHSLHGSYASSTVPQDSVGIERIDGEVFVVHEVSPGETLFALSRQYHTEVDLIRKVNTAINVDLLDIGDSLRIPLFPQLYQGKKSKHRVQEGETLFRISRKYEVSIDDIKKWNALGNQTLSIGQDIVIYHIENNESAGLLTNIDEQKYVAHTVQPGETLYAISRAYGISVNELKQRNKLSNESIDLGQKLIIREREVLEAPELSVSASTVNTATIPDPISTKKATAIDESEEEEIEDEAEEVYDRRMTRAEALQQEKERMQAIRSSEKKALSEYEKKSEMGFAAAIEGGIETKKFLALHRTAPVGTIIQIRNEMNNLSVFVRVVGKLPATGNNNKVNIRISQAAYDKLGGINERFPVEITYIQ